MEAQLKKKGIPEQILVSLGSKTFWDFFRIPQNFHSHFSRAFCLQHWKKKKKTGASLAAGDSEPPVCGRSEELEFRTVLLFRFP